MFINKINTQLTGAINSNEENFFKNASKIDDIDTQNKSSFKSTLTNMAVNINKEINAPDEMLTEVMSGTGKYDLHDVMIALSKADISINIATTAATKVIQSYEKIMQIQL